MTEYKIEIISKATTAKITAETITTNDVHCQ